MTIGTFVVAAGLLTAIVEIVFAIRMRADGRVSESAFAILMMGAIALPIALYAIFRYIVPELGDTVMF